MGGFFGVVSKQDCVLDIFFGVDYHSHLGTRRGGMILYDKERGFQRRRLGLDQVESKLLGRLSEHFVAIGLQWEDRTRSQGRIERAGVSTRAGAGRARA